MPFIFILAGLPFRISITSNADVIGDDHSTNLVVHCTGD